MAEKDKPKKAKQDDLEQSRRFVETARELESDESGKSFERAVKAVMPNLPTRPKRPEVVSPLGETLEKLATVKEKQLALLRAKKAKK